MLQRHNREIDRLDKRPHHPVLRQGVPVCLVQLVLGARPLHHRHAAQEEEEVDRREECLISRNSGNGFDVLVPVDDLVREELEPSGGSGTEYSYVSIVSVVGYLSFGMKDTPPPYSAILPERAIS